MNQSVEEMRESCKTKTENTARTEACVTRIEEVAMSNTRSQSVRKRESSEKGRPRENTIIDNQANRKALNARRRVFRSAVWCRHCIKGREREEAVAKQLKEREKSQKSLWTACSLATRRKGKRWCFGWTEKGRRELCSALCFRGSRRETGYVER